MAGQTSSDPGTPPAHAASLKLGVIGAGAFGTATASALARAGRPVQMYCRTPEQAALLRRTGENPRYLPGQRLPPGILATNDLDDVIDSDVVFLAFPARSMDEYAARFEGRLRDGALVVNLVKGLHEQTFTFAELFARRLPGIEYVALKGPTFARPLFNLEWSGLTCGTASPRARETVGALFRGIAVELDHHPSAEAVDAVSAVKNIYAIALGIVASLGLSENTYFLMISRVIKEITGLMVHLGYGIDVVTRHCGLADTLLTGLCDTSRNRTIGIMIGKGILADASAAGFLAEGLRSVRILQSHVAGYDAPLLAAVAEVLGGRAAPISLLPSLR